jgi:hypothetical protein
VARKSVLQLQVVTKELARTGYDVRELEAVTRELRSLERPPGLAARMSRRLKDMAAAQWRNLVGELEESREAFALLTSAMKGKKLTPEERDMIRAQMLDLVRLFPAGLIAAANSAFPIPGTGLLTPWILRKMGLLPSRWREAHVLTELRKEANKLRKAGNLQAAERLLQIEQDVEREAAERERVARDTELLTHWDENRNGQWDPPERKQYEAELARLKDELSTSATRRRWFFSYQGEVFGPLRLGDLEKRGAPSASLLCCYDGKSGWVAVSDLLGLEPAEEPDLLPALPELPALPRLR